jgi:hypothetical protein
MEVHPAKLVFGRLKRGHSYALEIKVSTCDRESVEISVVGGTPACLRVHTDTWARPGIVRAVVQAQEAGNPFIGSIRCIASGGAEVTVPVSAHVVVDASADPPKSLPGMTEAPPSTQPEIMPLFGSGCVSAVRIQSRPAASISRPTAAPAQMRPSIEKSLSSESTSTPTTIIGDRATGGSSVASQDPAACRARHVSAQAIAVLMEENISTDQRVWWAPFNGAFEGYLDALQRSFTVVQRQVRSVQYSTAEMRTLHAALESTATLFETVRSGARRQRESLVSRDKVPRQTGLVQSGSDRVAQPACVDATIATSSHTAAAEAAIAVMQQKLEEMVNSNHRLQLAVAEEHEMHMRVEQQRDRLRAEMFHMKGRDESAAASASSAVDSALQEVARLRNDLEDARERIQGLMVSVKEAADSLKLAEYNLEAAEKLNEQKDASVAELERRLNDAQYCAVWQRDATLLLARLRSWGLRSDVARRIPQAEMLFSQASDSHFSSKREDWLGTVAILLEHTERLLNENQLLPRQDELPGGSKSLQRWLKSARVKDLDVQQKLFDTRKWLSRTLAAKHVENTLHVCWRGWLSHTLQAKKDRHADMLAQSSLAKSEAERALLAQAQETKRLKRELGQARTDLDREKNAREKAREQMSGVKISAEGAGATDAAATRSAEAARSWTARLAEKEAQVQQLQGELTRMQAEQQGAEARLKRSREELKIASRRAEEGERLLAVYHKENMKAKGYDPIAASVPTAVHAVLNPTLRGGAMPSPRASVNAHAWETGVMQAMQMVATPRSAAPTRPQTARPSSARPRSIPWSTSLSTTVADVIAIDSPRRQSRPWSAAAGSSCPSDIVVSASPRRASAARPQSAALARAWEPL